MRNLPFVPDRISFISFQFFGSLVITLFFLGACRKAEPVEMEGLYGRWDITMAERNGKETPYLRNGYFKINPDGTMTINITGEDESGKYTLDKNKLIMDSDKVFDIQLLQNDSLTIKYVANPNSHFLIYMMKKKEDAQ